MDDTSGVADPLATTETTPPAEKGLDETGENDEESDVEDLFRVDEESHNDDDTAEPPKDSAEISVDPTIAEESAQVQVDQGGVAENESEVSLEFTETVPPAAKTEQDPLPDGGTVKVEEIPLEAAMEETSLSVKQEHDTPPIDEGNAAGDHLDVPVESVPQPTEATKIKQEIITPKKEVNTAGDKPQSPVLSIPRKSSVSASPTVKKETKPSSLDPTTFGLPKDVVIPASVDPSLLQGRLIDTIRSLPHQLINDALVEYDDAITVKGGSIRNRGAYLYGVMKRYVSVHERASRGEKNGAVLMGPDLTPAVNARLQKLVGGGFCTQEEMNDKVKSKIRMLSERDALFAIDELAGVERGQIRNFGSYFMGILNRYMRGESAPRNKDGKNPRGSNNRPASPGRSSLSKYDNRGGRDNRFDRTRDMDNRRGDRNFRDKDSYRRERSRDRHDDRPRDSKYDRYTSDRERDSRYGPPQASPPSGFPSLPPRMNGNPPPPPPRPPMGAPGMPGMNGMPQHTMQQPQYPGAPQQAMMYPPGGPMNQSQSFQYGQNMAPNGQYPPTQPHMSYQNNTPPMAPQHQQQMQPPPQYGGYNPNAGMNTYQNRPQPQQQQHPHQQQFAPQQQQQQQHQYPGQQPQQNYPSHQNQYSSSQYQQQPNQFSSQQSQPGSAYRPGGAPQPNWNHQQPQGYQQAHQSQLPVDIQGLASKAASAVQALANQNRFQPQQPGSAPMQPPGANNRPGQYSNSSNFPGGSSSHYGRPGPPYGQQPHPGQGNSISNNGPQHDNSRDGGRRRLIASISELSPAVQMAVYNIQSTGQTNGPLDEGILGMINDLPDHLALYSLQKFSSIDKSVMRDKTAYLAGLLRRELEMINKR